MKLRPAVVSLCAITACAVLAMPVSAQRYDSRYDSYGRPAAAPVYSGGGGGSATDSARLDVRISQLEEQLRRMNGRLEEAEFQNRKLAESLQKLSADVDFRLNEIERRGAGSMPSAGMIDTSSEQPVSASASQARASGAEWASANTGTVSDTTRPLGAPESADDPKVLYSNAFKLLNQAKFDEAARSLKGFTERYPNDPLIGNVFYWLGETHYVRKDFVSAADSFRQGYEKMPKGPKAADNLLKLGMSLGNLGKSKESCVVYGQLLSKFADASVSVKQKADQERARLGCS